MKTLLVPHDFSEMSDAAADEAAGLAVALKAKVVLVHMHFFEHIRPEQQTGEHTYDQMERDRLQLEAIGARLKEKFGDIEFEATVELGTPADGLLEVAKNRNVDMIVMGTHGRSGLSHLVLGSVAEKVVQKSPIPVLVTKARKDPDAQAAA